MPRFDLANREGPAKTVLHPDGRERVFVLPYDTEDPEDIALLRTHPLLVETSVPVPVVPIPEPEPIAPKPTKTSRKEVDE